MPGPQDSDPASERAAEDAVWRSIVENYGDRALLDDDPGQDAPDQPHQPDQPDAAAQPEQPDQPDQPEQTEQPRGLRRPGEVPGSTRDLFRDLAPQTSGAWEAEREEHYVPPPPPPVPRTTPARAISWVGLFGVPLLMLVAVVAGVSVPSELGLILMVWFVGGFVYLVASMRPGPRDDDDDGAVV